MNQNLQDILVKTLEKAVNASGEIYDATKDGLAKAIDFASEQIPEIITQLLKWEFVYHFIWAIAWLILSLTLILFGKKILSNIKKNLDKWDDGFIFALRCTSGALIVISSILIMTSFLKNVTICAKIHYAPKVFLIEYCSDLIRVKKYNETHSEYYPEYPIHNH